ncbi:MAG: trimethylamine methyltransferase family protein [Acidimicrobiia bacterium]|nr:MAG: trimethylamine methyltransferase family protein [Acidimicrobiia bacterium]
MTQQEAVGQPRRRASRRRTAQAPSTDHYRQLTNPYEFLRVLDDDQIDAIHQAALHVLANDGMRVLEPEGIAHFTAAGAAVDEQLVRLDPELVAASLATAPAEFDITSRSPQRQVRIGGRNVVNAPVGGPPHATDLDQGRRAGTLQDFENFVRLTQHYDVVHINDGTIEPQDVPIAVRHLETVRAMLTLSDKVPFVYARGRGQVSDAFDMQRIVLGLSEDEFAEQPRCFTVINTNSPRQLDVPMCLGIIQFAEMKQVSVITPFTLAGAMAPVTLAGALTLQHAEALFGITLAQIVRPGAPVVYGAFTSNVDMRSGAPSFGTPEAFQSALASGQLARHLGLPWRSSGSSTSPIADAQSGYETMMNMMGAVLGGANVIIHAAGWVESGLSASYEKFILDVEMLQMLAEAFSPLATTEADLGVDAISGVDPGGHFFGTEHTLERYDTAFYEPIVFTRNSFEQWEEAGAPTATERANAVWKQVLTDFEPPPLDEAVLEELDEFVERRTAEGGALPP